MSQNPPVGNHQSNDLLEAASAMRILSKDGSTTNGNGPARMPAQVQPPPLQLHPHLLLQQQSRSTSTYSTSSLGSTNSSSHGTCVNSATAPAAAHPQTSQTQPQVALPDNFLAAIQSNNNSRGVGTGITEHGSSMLRHAWLMSQVNAQKNNSMYKSLSQQLVLTEETLIQTMRQRDECIHINEDLKLKLQSLLIANDELGKRNKSLEQDISILRSQLIAANNRPGNIGLSKNEEKWNRRYIELKEYKEKYGDCLVPQRYKENPQLGVWVATQRNAYEEYRLTKDRIEKLELLGFVWDASAKKSRIDRGSSPTL